jgi:hypothetical protein
MYFRRLFFIFSLQNAGTHLQGGVLFSKKQHLTKAAKYCLAAFGIKTVPNFFTIFLFAYI